MAIIKARFSQREFDSKYIEEQLVWIKTLKWTLELWKPKTALVDKNGNIKHLFIGQKFDPNYFELVDKAWSHEHCDICSGQIEKDDTSAVAEGNILCCLCFEDFVKI